MDTILPKYSVGDATWFYLSLLLIVAVFFRFNRFWSLRNFDLFLLLSISPGLLMVREAEHESFGYAWLFAGTGFFLIRLFCDPVFKRRPRLEQNLNVPGLTFLGVAAFAFLMTKVVTEPPPESTVETVRRADQLLNLQDVSFTVTRSRDLSDQEAQAGPATPLLAAPVVPTSRLVASTTQPRVSTVADVEQLSARLVAVLAHFTVILGLIMLGRLHLGDTQLGLAMAALYLLLPCTAYDVGRVNQVLPSALIVWAFVAYRMPMVAGALLGLACGSLLFPVFLLPLWVAFYWGRGAVRFGIALLVVGAILLTSLILTSADTHSLTRRIIGSIDWTVLHFQGERAGGFWSTHDSAYRIPIVAAFVVMLGILTALPRRKNLEHLMAHSTAIIVATQLWYPRQGGAYVLWYLPLLLMVVFRPRLSHLFPPELRRTKTATEHDSDETRPALAVTGGAGNHQRLFR